MGRELVVRLYHLFESTALVKEKKVYFKTIMKFPRFPSLYLLQRKALLMD